MNPLKVGYQYIPDEARKMGNKLRNNDLDQFRIGAETLGSQGSPSNSTIHRRDDSRSVMQMQTLLTDIDSRSIEKLLKPAGAGNVGSYRQGAGQAGAHKSIESYEYGMQNYNPKASYKQIKVMDRLANSTLKKNL